MNFFNVYGKILYILTFKEKLPMINTNLMMIKRKKIKRLKRGDVLLFLNIIL